MTIVYKDGTWFKGDRKWHFLNETKGTHHFIVLDGSEEFKKLIGKRVAVPIPVVKYFVLNERGRNVQR